MADAPDFIPDGEFTPDAPIAPAKGIQPKVAAKGMQTAPDFIPDDQFESDEDKYGTPGEEAKAFLEGAGEGIVGPAAPMIEKAFGATNESIRGRAAASPILKGAGTAAGLVGGALTGVGEAALLGKAGEAAKAAVGLADLGKDASLGMKVGAAAVGNAAEMAVLSGSDDAAKMVVKDPNTSAETAIANAGLAAALGAGGGAFGAGVISPLWQATAGPKLESLLGMVKSTVNGGTLRGATEGVESAARDLGVELDPIMRAGMSDNVKAQEIFSTLKRAENPQILEKIEDLHSKVSHSVADSLGMTADDVSRYSENEAGHDLHDTFKKEFEQKYAPIAEALEKRDAEAAHIHIPDETRLQHYNTLLEKGMNDVGTDSPYYKLYNQWGDRVLAKDTVGGMDKLKTEINNKIKGLKVGGDHNEINVLSDIKSSIADLQSKFRDTDAAGQAYAKFAKMSDTLTNHLGIGDFRGAGTLGAKLADKIAAEDLLKKFSIRGNSDFIPFLAEHFPETLQKVLENERKQLIKPAILAANKKGELPIDVKKLSDIIDKGMAGKKEYIEAILPQETLRRVEAGKTLLNAIPSPRDSGTPAGLAKIFKHMPSSALAAVGWMTGHNPILSGLIGETVGHLGKNLPEAAKLSYLRFLAADKPISAPGFKAMTEFINAAQKGEKMINTATLNVLKPGVHVLPPSSLPSAEDLIKLDKLVSKNEDKPKDFVDQQEQSHLGHYLPDHQVGVAATSARALQYLQGIKPRPFKASPLDREIAPLPQAVARYNRALAIAQQPAVVLKHVKDGTVKLTDLQDLKAMYPGVYDNMSQKLIKSIVSRKADDGTIPYKTRMGLSLFLGQPLDSSMTPASIMAAQPMPKQSPAPPQQQSGPKKSTASIGKNIKQYRTAGQAAEADRNGRD